MLFVLLRTPVDIPLEDDYFSVLSSVMDFLKLNTFSAQAKYILFTQYVQYKLVVLLSIVTLQYKLLGHLDLISLEYFGDASIFLTGYFIYRLFKRTGRPLWLFLPACCLTFMPQYNQTLNWASSGLQNLIVVPFLVLTLITFDRPGRRNVLISYAALIMAILSSGNGLVAAMAGGIVLLLQQRWKRLAGWSAVTLAMAYFYFFNYVKTDVGHPMTLRHAIKPFVLIPFGFLGAPFANLRLAVLAGLVIVVLCVMLVRKGWLRADPSSFAIALFVLITSVGVAYTRHRFGAGVATSGRYRMYGQLMMTVLYLGVLRLYVPNPLTASRQWVRGLTAFAAFCLICCGLSDYFTYQYLMERNRVATASLILWLRHPGTTLSVPDEVYSPDIKDYCEGAIRAAVQQGVYIPPVSASTPMPIAPHARETIARDHLQIPESDLVPGSR